MACGIGLGTWGRILHPFGLPQLEGGDRGDVPVLDRPAPLALAGVHHAGGHQPVLRAGPDHRRMLHRHRVHHMDQEPAHELPEDVEDVHRRRQQEN